MHATDVMSTDVITVQPDTQVRDIAALLLKHRISAVPVIDGDRQVVGIVSEGDLMRRVENDTANQHSWWLEAVFSATDKAQDYIKTHGRKASDVMSRDVVTATEDMSLGEIAGLLEKHRIKRVPIMRGGRLVGIVSRANLLHGLAGSGAALAQRGSGDDRTIREELLGTLARDAGLLTGSINVIVTNGVVQLWGVVDNETERKAAQVAAENIAGVQAVENHIGLVPAWMWGE